MSQRAMRGTGEWGADTRNAQEDEGDHLDLSRRGGSVCQAAQVSHVDSYTV